MKNILNNNFNLYPENILKNKQNYYFYYNNVKYYLIVLNRTIDEIELLSEITYRLHFQNSEVYLILKDVNNKTYIEHEEKQYILLRSINDEQEELFMNDILLFSSLLKTKQDTYLNRNNWVDLWSEKVDYYESKLQLISKVCPEILNSFSYYIGMAENAISFVVDALAETTKTDELVISHKRIRHPLSSSKLYNPLNFIFDYEVRDPAEYLKIKFFNDNVDLLKLEELILKKRYSPFLSRMFYARLLFPSYYFDILDEIIINNKIDEKKIKKLLVRIDDYEEFLFDIYIMLKKVTPIPSIDWIVSSKKLKSTE